MIRHVYVHAPFCARRCVYCDFAVTVERAPAGEPWLAAIGREFETLRASGDLPLAPEVDTLYVGGGTPSLLDPRLVGRLPSTLGISGTLGIAGADAGSTGPAAPSPVTDLPVPEWTVEANPESFTDAVARAWTAAGVNRISLGVQSFDPGALKWMGRLHSPSDAVAAVHRARAAGVANVSIDLIFGLPDTVSRSWEADLRQTLDLAPPHVSLYGLSVEKGARLFRDVESGRTPPPSPVRYQEEYLAAAERLAEAGYEHYEVSNFALPGFSSRHNRAYWSGAPYLGLGNGAHSFHDGRRWWNEREWETYRTLVTKTGRGRADEERLSQDQVRLESIWLGLRTADGLDLSALSVGDAGLASLDQVVRGWETRALAVRDGTRARLTPAGWLLLDDLAVELDMAPVDASGREAIFNT